MGINNSAKTTLNKNAGLSECPDQMIDLRSRTSTDRRPDKSTFDSFYQSYLPIGRQLYNFPSINSKMDWLTLIDVRLVIMSLFTLE